MLFRRRHFDDTSRLHAVVALTAPLRAYRNQEAVAAGAARVCAEATRIKRSRPKASTVANAAATMSKHIISASYLHRAWAMGNRAYTRVDSTMPPCISASRPEDCPLFRVIGNAGPLELWFVGTEASSHIQDRVISTARASLFSCRPGSTMELHIRSSSDRLLTKDRTAPIVVGLSMRKQPYLHFGVANIRKPYKPINAV